jgi:peptidoglycan/LPS O-acetylase OafA/YrhL
MPEQTTTTPSRPRLYYLDWLRVLSMLAVFLYHFGMRSARKTGT